MLGSNSITTPLCTEQEMGGLCPPIPQNSHIIHLKLNKMDLQSLNKMLSTALVDGKSYYVRIKSNLGLFETTYFSMENVHLKVQETINELCKGQFDSTGEIRVYCSRIAYELNIIQADL
jgi:hypothetical protein